MKKNLLLIFGLILSSLALTGQECNEALLLSKPGIWKEGLKGSVSGIAATDLVREKTIISNLHSMIKANYNPMGLVADFSFSYERPYPNMSSNIYAYSIIPLGYYCENNTVKTSHETSTYFQIRVNGFEAEIYDTLDISELTSGTGYHYLADMPIEKDGYYYFKEKDVTLAFGLPGKSGRWLITLDGKLPYAYVTKKEFLERRKKILINSKSNAERNFKDVLNNIEIERKFKAEEYKGDPERLKKYMKMDYNNIKQRYEKLLAETDQKYRPAFLKIETLLGMDASALSQPSIVKNDPQDYLSYLFVDESDPMGEILIKPNPSYFNKKLPRYTPQFFSVFITGSHKDPIASRCMEGIIKAVDFKALKNMIGK
jgi:hypothetical protein